MSLDGPTTRPILQLISPILVPLTAVSLLLDTDKFLEDDRLTMRGEFCQTRVPANAFSSERHQGHILHRFLIATLQFANVSESEKEKCVSDYSVILHFRTRFSQIIYIVNLDVTTDTSPVCTSSPNTSKILRLVTRFHNAATHSLT